MAKRFDIADKRIFGHVYICRRCNARNRLKTLRGAKCRKCQSRALRLKHKDLKA